MKYMLLLFFLFSSVIVTRGQTLSPLENVVITSKKKKTQVRTNENGELHVNVSPKDVSKFKAIGLVHYSDFGAKGDGKTDDIDAIAAAHAFANQHGLLVKADEGATYYIAGKEPRSSERPYGCPRFGERHLPLRPMHLRRSSASLQRF